MMLRNQLFMWRAVLALCSLLYWLAVEVHAADITVDGSACTLADAIAAANDDTAHFGCSAGSGEDTISLSDNITLSAELPEITSDIIIEGNEKTISGAEANRIFSITEASVVINDLTLSNALSATFGGAIHINKGTLTINRSTIEDNVANDSGGGVYSVNSHVTVVESKINDNNAKRSHGGGIYFISPTLDHRLRIDTSSFEDNTATQDGGALYISGGDVEIIKSSFLNNSADEGGAIENNSSTLKIENSTFGRNSAREAGGLSSFGSDVTLIHTTWAYNSALEQGGAVALIGTTGTLRILNTILSNSPSGGDCHSGLKPEQIVENTSNVIQDGSCPLLTAGAESQSVALSVQEEESTDKIEPGEDDELVAQQADDSPTATPTPVNIDPMLLEEEGWPPHYPLHPNSPAMDAADTTLCDTLSPVEDQPGKTRPVGPGCEIGAWEAPPTPQPPTRTPRPATSTPRPTSTPVPTSTLMPTATTNVTPTVTPTATTSLTPPIPQYCIHVVEPGENLFRIAIDYGLTVRSISSFNSLLSDDRLAIGQQIAIPHHDCAIYTPRKG